MTSQEGEKNTGRHLILIGRMIKIHLLLEACFDFKTESDYEGVNWESKRTKYEQIKTKFCEQYPEVEDEKFPRSNDLDSIMENNSSCIQQTVGIQARLVNQEKTTYEQQYEPPFSPPSQSRSMDTLRREMS